MSDEKVTTPSSGSTVPGAENILPETPGPVKDIFNTPQTDPGDDPRDAIDKVVRDAKAIIDWAAEVEKQGHVLPSAPATKEDIDGLRDAVRELTSVSTTNGKTMLDIITRLKAGRF